MKAKQTLTARDLRLIREAVQAEVYPLKRRIAALEKKLKGPISAIVSIQSELKAVDGSGLRIENPAA